MSKKNGMFKLMSEQVRKKRQDEIKINLKQNHEVEYWSRKWAISPLQLELAVKAAGSSVAKDVETYLFSTGKIHSSLQ